MQHSFAIAEPITSPGLHCIGNLRSSKLEYLNDYIAFKSFVDGLITRHRLTKVGEVYHRFDTGGFTAVVCLSESHLSIHTWPEHGYLTFDVFLSNYMRDNRLITEGIYQSTVRFFEATVLSEQYIDR